MINFSSALSLRIYIKAFAAPTRGYSLNLPHSFSTLVEWLLNSHNLQHTNRIYIYLGFNHIDISSLFSAFATHSQRISSNFRFTVLVKEL